MSEQTEQPSKLLSFPPDKVSERLHKAIDEWGLPQWIKKQLGNCPECKKPLSVYSIRGIGVKLNPQHIGNFCMDIMCEECHAGFELHGLEGARDFDGFLATLQEGLFSEFVPHHHIPANVNNLSQMMIEDLKEEERK